LTPEQTEGPYFIAGEAIRTDITEGKAGMPLRLALTVVNANRCAAIASASIDIWHADAGGNYSGFGSASSNRTFLRGVQVTNAAGAAGFLTIYPGWYQGRATHIHVKVHVGGSVVHTGQLFFDESINQAVYATAPYSSHAGTRTLNSQDNIYASGGALSLVRLTREGIGYVGTITLGVQT
jgi:protocatechuate 3,4-dioxygenase beta subunit